MSDKIHLPWGYVEHRCKLIAKDIESKYNLDQVNLIGVARGGMIPVTLVAHLLDKRYQMLDLHSYMGKESGVMVEEYALKLNKDKVNIIIDDIFDTGKTFQYINNNYQIDRFYYVVDKRDGESKNLGWIVFPWEKESLELTNDENNNKEQ